MARDDDDDLYDEEFDFVDDDEDDLDREDSSPAEDTDIADDASPIEGEIAVEEAADANEVVDEYGRPAPVANYVVHVYEHKKFKRTIDRPFTPEDAEAFATEFNRTSKSYGRFAVTGKNDAQPKKVLD
jgi:hypothetical protein